MNTTSRGIGYDRVGPSGRLPIVLVHAGIADRRMWNPQWSTLAADHDVIRLDLTGFGESDTRPEDRLDHLADVLGTLSELQVEQAHFIGASYGAGIATEVAISRPELVASLLLSAPGGSLMSQRTDDLTAFFEAEDQALADDDLTAAVEANIATWVDGPGQPADRVAAEVRAAVTQMQRQAFEIQVPWGDVESVELDPPVLDRLTEIVAPTLVLVGGLDVQAIRLAAAQVTAGIPGARQVDWAGVAHLPSMERPDEFCRLVTEHLAEAERA